MNEQVVLSTRSDQHIISEQVVLLLMTETLEVLEVLEHPNYTIYLHKQMEQCKMTTISANINANMIM